MTNEEIINRLDEITSFCDFTDEYGDSIDSTPYHEALDLAIKALESWDKIDTIIIEQLDKSTDQKECMTLRWVLDRMSEVRG